MAWSREVLAHDMGGGGGGGWALGLACTTRWLTVYDAQSATHFMKRDEDKDRHCALCTVHCTSSVMELFPVQSILSTYRPCTCTRAVFPAGSEKEAYFRTSHALADIRRSTR